MHQGHFRNHISETYRVHGPAHAKPFFSSNACCSVYLKIGVALWLKSIRPSVSEPCCPLDIIGGDGTGIGIPVKNALHIDDVWRPKHSSPPMQWGRRDRSVIEMLKLPHEVEVSVRAMIQTVLTSEDLPSPVEVTSALAPLPDNMRAELLRFCGLSRSSRQYVPLRQYLRTVLSKDSLTGCFPKSVIRSLESLLSQPITQLQIRTCNAAVCDKGICNLLLHLLDIQFSEGRVHDTFLSLLRELGKPSAMSFSILSL